MALQETPPAGASLRLVSCTSRGVATSPLVVDRAEALLDTGRVHVDGRSTMRS